MIEEGTSEPPSESEGAALVRVDGAGGADEALRAALDGLRPHGVLAADERRRS